MIRSAITFLCLGTLAVGIILSFSGCVTAPIELDPMVGFSKALGEFRSPAGKGELSQIRLAVILSPTVNMAISVLENTRQTSVRLLNPMGLPDLDDQQIY